MDKKHTTIATHKIVVEQFEHFVMVVWSESCSIAWKWIFKIFRLERTVPKRTDSFTVELDLQKWNNDSVSILKKFNSENILFWWKCDIEHPFYIRTDYDFVFYIEFMSEIDFFISIFGFHINSQSIRFAQCDYMEV